MKKALSVFILTMVCALWNPNTTYATQTFKIGQKTFLLDGKPFVVKAAEMHYPRIPRPYWEHRIQMCKALGMNTHLLVIDLGSEQTITALEYLPRAEQKKLPLFESVQVEKSFPDHCSPRAAPAYRGKKETNSSANRP